MCSKEKINNMQEQMSNVSREGISQKESQINARKKKDVTEMKNGEDGSSVDWKN